MLYKSARNKMKSGDVVAWSGNSIFSKLIKFCTRSIISHVGIVWKIGGRVFVLESYDGKGVQIFPLSRRAPFYWYKTNCKWAQETEEFALKTVGDKYSWIGCLKAWLNIKTKRDKRWQCAEFVNAILKSEGWKIKGLETPAEIVNFLEANKCEKKHVRRQQ